MNVLNQNRYVIGGLQDLIRVVVPGRDRRHPMVGDAAHPRCEVQPRAGAASVLLGPGGGPRLPFRRQPRQPAIGRIDDQRRSALGVHASFVKPKRVVGAHASRYGRTFGAGRRVPCGRFLRREELLAGELGGPLERRERGVGPKTPQVRIAPSCARGRPCRFRVFLSRVFLSRVFLSRVFLSRVFLSRVFLSRSLGA